MTPMQSTSHTIVVPLDVVQFVIDVLNKPVPGVGYLWGKAGMGKTFLLQYLGDQHRTKGQRVIWTRGPDLYEPSLWKPDWRDEPWSFPQMRRALLKKAKAEPFVWIIDGIDRMPDAVGDVSELALDLGRLGGRVLMTGRTPPSQLWPAGSYMGTQLATFEMPPWDHRQAEHFLRQRGMTDAAMIRQAMALGNGCPQILATLADSLTLVQEAGAEDATFLTDPSRCRLFFLEQLCHPGSRRVRWRAGQASEGLDTLIAAAALVPRFTRAWMQHVVGLELTAQHWEAFVDLPILHAFYGGYYGLSVTSREVIGSAAQTLRPWMWEQWTRRSTAYTLVQVHAGELLITEAWRQLLPCIRPCLGEAPLDFTASGASVTFTPGTSAYEARCLDHQGTAQASAECLKTADVLRIRNVVWNPDWPSSLPYLIGGLVSTFHDVPRVYWELEDAESPATAWLTWLGFVRQTPTEWALSLQKRPLVKRWQDWTAPPNGPVPDNPVAAVQRILLTLREGHPSLGPEVEAFWKGLARRGTFRAWFLDALHSADLGQRSEGKALLVLYYLDQHGTHEDLAEFLHMSRATYFRNHRQALERLSAAVFLSSNNPGRREG